MKKEYDFTGGKRGPVLEVAPGKTRITIRLDDDVLEWFRGQARAAGGGNYQTMINQALRDHIVRQEQPLEDLLRRILREELHAAHREASAESAPHTSDPCDDGGDSDSRPS